jgi:putative peptide zinc metalloprotease protein
VPTDAFPRFRTDLIVRRIVEGGRIGYTIHDPVPNHYFRQDSMAQELAFLLDGTRGTDELLAEMNRRYPQYTFDEEWIDEILEIFRKLGFLEDVFNRNLLMQERARTARRNLLSAESLRNVLNIQLGSFDPMPLFEKVYPFVRVIFTRAWVVGTVLAFVIAVMLLWDRRDVMLANLLTIFSLEGGGWLGLLVLYVVLFLIVVAHEFGHGLCCMHYGGRPSRIGFMFLYFMPGMFCDTSDIYFFEKRWPRAAVALAGGYMEVQIFAIATFLWTLTPPDLYLHQLAYRVMLFSGATGLVMNYNPLIKLDGYYVLMSYLNISQLREKSFEWLGGFAKSLLTRKPNEVRATRRERRIFLAYGVAAIVYSTTFLWVSVLFVRGVLVGVWREVGAGIFLLFVVYIARKPAEKLLRRGRLLVLEHAGFVRRHTALLVGAAALALFALLFPWPRTVLVTATLEPLDKYAVRARVGGRIAEVLIEEGALLRAGTIVAVLDRGDAEAERQNARSTLSELTLRSRMLSAADRRAGLSGQRAAAARVAGAEWSAGEAWLSAPADGRLLTSRPERWIGRAVEAGDSVFAVGRIDSLAVLLSVSEREVADLSVGRIATLRLRANPERTARFRIEAVDLAPARATPTGTALRLATGETPPARYVARGRIENPGGMLRPGFSGSVRVGTEPLSLISRLLRLYARLVRADFWF